MIKREVMLTTHQYRRLVSIDKIAAYQQDWHWIFGPPEHVLYGTVFGWRLFTLASPQVVEWSEARARYTRKAGVSTSPVLQVGELLSLTRLASLGIDATHLLSATCRRWSADPETRAAHAAPDELCRCGLYAYATLRDLMWMLRHEPTFALLCAVIALVQLEGPVVFHNIGSRAAHQRILRLFVPPRTEHSWAQEFPSSPTPVRLLRQHYPDLPVQPLHAMRHVNLPQKHPPVDLRGISIHPSELT